MSKPNSAPGWEIAQALGTQLANRSHQQQFDFSSVLADCQIETTTDGASTLTLTIADPELAIYNSGIVDIDDSNNYALLDLELDLATGTTYWSLVEVDIQTDNSQANLTLTFEDRIIHYLRLHEGPVTATRGPLTRAQFIQGLVNTVQSGGGINFICPELTVVQPIGSDAETMTGLARLVSRSKGISTNRPTATLQKVGQTATVSTTLLKTQKPTSNQPTDLANMPVKVDQTLTLLYWDGSTFVPTPTMLKNAQTALDVADSLGAGTTATVALLEACIVESKLQNLTYGDGTSTGILQVLSSTASSMGITARDVAQVCNIFLTKGFTDGVGAIDYANNHPNASPGEVAQHCQGSAEPTRYDKVYSSALKLINAYGGVGKSQLSLGNSTDKSYQFTVGTSSNPTETYWDASQRLAQEVQWYCWSDGQDLMYMNAYDILQQKPKAIIDVGGVKRGRDQNDFGGVTYYADDHPLHAGQTFHGTVASFSGQIMSQLANGNNGSTELTLDLVCDPDDFHAGDILVLHRAGPASAGQFQGRWMIQDATRSIFDTYTEFTLQIPQMPLDEPTATGGSTSPAATSSTGGVDKDGNFTSTGNGSRDAIVQAALKAIAAQKADASTYVYSQGTNRGNNGTLFGPSPRTMDCSSFFTLCYKAGGAPDPNGADYNPIGWTGTLFKNGQNVTNPQPGDACFYFPGETDGEPGHVALYLGNGQIANMGAPGEPVQEAVDAPAKPFAYCSYLPN